MYPLQGQQIRSDLFTSYVKRENSSCVKERQDNWGSSMTEELNHLESSQNGSSQNQVLSFSSSPENIDFNRTIVDLGDQEDDFEQDLYNNKLITVPINLHSSAKSLSLRLDVMNKNFFRAFRRECKTLFSKFLTQNLLSESNNKRVFAANL